MNDFKTVLRKQILPARKILARHVWEERNKQIHLSTLNFIRESSAQVIHSFLPIEKNKEVDTWPIIHELLAEGKKVVISRTDLDRETMSHYYYHPGIKFRLNRLKIPEPVNAQPADIKEIELILIPLLSADKMGNRIGYGKGYYDRLLNKLPQIKKVGLSLGPLFDAFNFVQDHDIKLDYCISPFEVYKCL